MSKTKISDEEKGYVIAFGKELDRRMIARKMGFAELGRLIGPDVSSSYISDIVRAGRGTSKKLFRPSREKVQKIAQAMDWAVDEALAIAGFTSQSIDLSPERLASFKREEENFRPLTEEERKRIEPYKYEAETTDPLEEALISALGYKMKQGGLSRKSKQMLREILGEDPNK